MGKCLVDFGIPYVKSTLPEQFSLESFSSILYGAHASQGRSEVFFRDNQNQRVFDHIPDFLIHEYYDPWSFLPQKSRAMHGTSTLG
jgi:hypothetical protein